MWDFRLLLAHRRLALAAGWPELTGETQLLLVAAQVTLQAEGHLLVTGAQLLLTPGSLVSCGMEEWGAQCLSFPETESRVDLGSLEGASESSAILAQLQSTLPSYFDSSCVTLGTYHDLPVWHCTFIYLFIHSTNSRALSCGRPWGDKTGHSGPLRFTLHGDGGFMRSTEMNILQTVLYGSKERRQGYKIVKQRNESRSS